MVYELVIIAALLAIFIVVGRRIPDWKREIGKTIPQQAIAQTKSPLNLLEQAEIFFKERKFSQAEELYLKLAAQNPEEAKVYNRLGIIYLEQGSFADAKEAFQESLKHGGNKAGRYYNLALACLGLQELGNALEVMEKALKLDKENEKYQQLLAEIKEKMKKYKPTKDQRPKTKD